MPTLHQVRLSIATESAGEMFRLRRAEFYARTNYETKMTRLSPRLRFRGFPTSSRVFTRTSFAETDFLAYVPAYVQLAALSYTPNRRRNFSVAIVTLNDLAIVVSLVVVTR